MFAGPQPANTQKWDLQASDGAYRDRRVARIVTNIAKKYGVAPALLAEHLTAEVKHFESQFAKVPKGIDINEWVNVRTIETSNAGLDDWVRERTTIERLVPVARTIPEGLEAHPIPAESVVKKAQKTLTDIPPSAFKPQRRLSMYDCIQASAAYLKYKEHIVRHGLGRATYEDLPAPVRYQLNRLAVNPTGLGTQHWIDLARRGDFDSIFDFGPATSRDTGDSSVEDVVRRATIHTARTVHMAETIFGK
jgi:hypothetical protein